MEKEPLPLWEASVVHLVIFQEALLKLKGRFAIDRGKERNRSHTSNKSQALFGETL